MHPCSRQLQAAGIKLSDFQIDPDKQLDAYKWALLSVSPDRGPTGVSALNWAVGPGRLNIDVAYDFNHGSWDDEKNTIKDLGDHGWLLMMLIDVNVMEGPWETCTRFSETVSALSRLHRRELPERVPLFMEMAHCIMAEAGINAASEDALERAWALTGDAGVLRKRGYRCNLNRFHGFTERAEDEVKCWWARLFQYLYVSIEMDYLGSKNLPKLHLRMTREALYASAADDGASTSAGRITNEEKAVRAAAANAFGIATIMHADVSNLWKTKQLIAAASENKLWQGQANAYLRQVDRTAPWLYEQITKNFMACVCRIMSKPSSEAVLSEIGYSIPGRGHPILEEHVMFEDTMADSFQKYCMALVGNRIRRELWMFSFPSRGVKSLYEAEGVETPTLQELRADYHDHMFLKDSLANGEVGQALAALVRRSACNTLAGLQMARVGQQENWINTSRYRSWLTTRFLKILQSQLAEDCGFVSKVIRDFSGHGG